MSTQNITLKFKDVNVKQITCEAVKMGKDMVPLLRYGSDKKTLFIQGPWLKMRQYGVPPGETLSNGNKNDYYAGEDSRLSVRFPIDTSCSVQTDVENNPELTNSDEIQEFIKFLQVLDAHIKNETTFMSLSGIDSDDKEKYTPIYRKPVKSKKNTGKESKEKYYSMKTKLDTDGSDGDKKIKTEFYVVDRETKETKLVNSNKYITMEKLEETIKYNSEVLPIIQLVKIWTQSNGNWGVTLKLKKARVKNPVYSERGNAEFLESDPESEPMKKPVAKTKIVAVPDSDSDEEVTQVVSQTFHKISKNDNDSDEESDDEPVATKHPVKHVVAESESDDEQPVVTKTKHVVADSDSDDEVKPKKPVKKSASSTKTKKATA